MSFYLRKSVSVGPLRFNLSNSGLGLSAGVRGFRVGSGPRGNYVHMGRGGLYYRAALTGSSRNGARVGPTAPSPVRPPSDGAAMEAIDSGSVLEMVDASSAVLLEELNNKRRQWRVWPWLAILGFLGVGPTAGIHPAAPLMALLLLIILVWGVAQWDRLRLTTVLMYDLEEPIVERYQRLHDAFDRLAKAGRVGHIGAKGAVADGKYHAGASHVVRRRVVRPHKQPPRRVSTNIEVPAIPVGRQTLHFFPDRLLVMEPGGVGAVSYEDLIITPTPSRFIEEEGVPADATVVGQTWKYVNKKGGPDRRFKDNRQLPIALYEKIHFSSPTGLNEVIQVSCAGVGDLLNAAKQALVIPDADAARHAVPERRTRR